MYKPVRVTEGYYFDQGATLKRINLYSAGQFLDGSTDDMGEKVFFDITTPVVRNFAKNIDLDTKDFNFRAVNGKDYFKSWIYRRRARQWMRDTGLARKLNEIPERLCGYGTVVLKKVGTKEIFQIVDLRNLIPCDPSGKTLSKGAIEQLYFTPDELRGMTEAGWDKDAIEIAISDFQTHRKENYVGDMDGADQEYGDAQYIRVREFRGYVPKGLVDDSEDETMILAQIAVILPEDGGKQEAMGGKTNTSGTREGLSLFRGKLKNLGYKEIHFRKIDGRWLGRGLYEECFPAQEMKNTQVNWEILAMRLSQLILFQTRNQTVLQNVLSGLKNGDILKFSEGNQDDLRRVDTRITDNASNNKLAGEIRELISALSNSYEVTTGGNMPSGTPFSLGALQNQNANKLFDQVREDYGTVVEQVFEEWVLPELEKEMTLEGVIEITDADDLQYVRENYIKALAWDSVKGLILGNKKPTVTEVQMLEQFLTQQLEAKESLFIPYKKGFLSFDKKVEVIVTDERESSAMMQSLTTILQTVGQNPAIAQTPGFQRILDMVGLNITDVMPRQAPQPQQPQQPRQLPEEVHA